MSAMRSTPGSCRAALTKASTSTMRRVRILAGLCPVGASYFLTIGLHNRDWLSSGRPGRAMSEVSINQTGTPDKELAARARTKGQRKTLAHSNLGGGSKGGTNAKPPFSS
jgi:hypothetical protein